MADRKPSDQNLPETKRMRFEADGDVPGPQEHGASFSPSEWEQEDRPEQPQKSQPPANPPPPPAGNDHAA